MMDNLNSCVRFSTPIIHLILMAILTAGQVSAQTEPDGESADAELAAGHSLHGEAFDDGPRQAAYLMQGMGNVHWKITTSSPLAQRFFDQGLAQLHGFWYFEAERSFRQMAAFDPECAMAYWGMARANTLNEKRARGFIENAVKHKERASKLEQRLIDALAASVQRDAEGTPSTKKKRREDYAKALEEIALDFPKEIELKAMLVLQLWENEKDGLKVQSRLTVDAVLDQIFAANPRHPAHHFRIHLWDNARRDRALASAAACGPAAPGIAHMWHMPGHTYSGLKRYHDAAWQQEASARVDHAHMMRDRVMPDQIHNFAHNNEWLIRTWMKTGQVSEALALAKNMCQLPRHPKYNTLDKGSANYGRQRLINVLTSYGLWDEFVALSATPYLESTPDTTKQDERLAWQAAALAMTKRWDKADAAWREFEDRFTACNADLVTLRSEIEGFPATKPPTAPRSSSKGRSKVATTAHAPKLLGPIELDQWEWNEIVPTDSSASNMSMPKLDEDSIKEWTKPQKEKAKQFNELISRKERLREYRAMIQAYRAASNHNFDEAIAFARHTGKLLPNHHRLEWYSDSGRHLGAVRKAEEFIKTSVNEVIPLASGAWVAWQAQDLTRCREWLEQLASIGFAINKDLDLCMRLEPIIDELGMRAIFDTIPEPADDLGDRPPLDSLGPPRWSPYRAPSWSLEDAHQVAFSSKKLEGRPYVAIFYLGLGCLHCVEQLQAMSPMVDTFRESGLEVIAISSESMVSLKQSLANYTEPMNISLLPNPELDCFKSFRCFDDFDNLPLHGTFIIGPQGQVLWQDVGAEPFMNIEFLLGEAKRLMEVQPKPTFQQSPSTTALSR